jgi:hypothetical protein
LEEANIRQPCGVICVVRDQGLLTTTSFLFTEQISDGNVFYPLPKWVFRWNQVQPMVSLKPPERLKKEALGLSLLGLITTGKL